jgi:hypothetical protein
MGDNGVKVLGDGASGDVNDPGKMPEAKEHTLPAETVVGGDTSAPKAEETKKEAK